MVTASTRTYPSLEFSSTGKLNNAANVLDGSAADERNCRDKSLLCELMSTFASDAEIMIHLEHATDRAAQIYSRQANRRRRRHADGLKTRIDQSVKTLSNREPERIGIIHDNALEISCK